MDIKRCDSQEEFDSLAILVRRVVKEVVERVSEACLSEHFQCRARHPAVDVHFGRGAIGLGVIATSALVKASRIIAVDTNPGKEAWAKKMGATDFVNPAKLPEGKRIQDYLVEITDGGLDYTFDCTGNVHVMRAALEACHKGWGVSTIIGVAAAGQEISTRP